MQSSKLDNTISFIPDLTGQSVCGYPLEEFIGSTETSAVFRTTHNEQRAVIKLSFDEGRPFPAQRIDNANIIRLFESGECSVHGSQCNFVVMEAADENLASVLKQRALTPDEAREMLVPILDALAALHERGLVHTRIKPANIFAVGDRVKLSASSIRPAGPGASPEDDMRALGLTLVEVLTQQRLPSAIPDVPQPFRDIVERCLHVNPESRWSPRQVAMRLAGSMPAEAAPVAQPAPDPQPKREARPMWIYAAAASVVVILLILLFAGRGSSPAPAPKPNAQAPVAKTVPQELPKPTLFEKPHPVTLPRQQQKQASGNGWFVVVASYSHQADAEKRMRALAHQFPKFHPSVFPPSAIDPHYLVIVGSGLSQDAAQSLQTRAIASGLPRDTYIKKFPTRR